MTINPNMCGKIKVIGKFSIVVSNEDGLVGCKKVSWETVISINTPIKVREGYYNKRYDIDLTRLFRTFIDNSLWFDDPDYGDHISLSFTYLN